MTRLVIDTIHANVRNVPASAPTVAGYSTGSPDIQWTAADWQRFRRRRTIRIDQSRGTSPRSGDVKDSEAGASTIAEDVAWAWNRREIGWTSTIYIQASNLGELRAAVHRAGLDDHVFYWVANWNLSQREAQALLGGRIVAIQYASPTSNPLTLLPGSHLTLSEANCDLSVALESWFPERGKPPRRRKPPHPKVIGSSAGAALTAAVVAVLHAAGVHHLTPAEVGALTTLAGALGGYITPAKRGRR